MVMDLDATSFVSLLDAVVEGVVVFGADRKIIYGNQAFLDLSGFDRSELSGALCGIMQGPDTDPATVMALDEALTNRRLFCGEILNYRKSGEPFWNSLKVEPKFDQDGSFKYFIGVSHDISERKRTEVLANKFERDYQFIFDNVKSAITVHGADALIRLANPLAIELLGIEPGELAGSSPGDQHFRLFRRDGSEMPLDEYPVLRAIDTGLPVRDAVLGYHREKDGKCLWFVCNASPVLDDSGCVAEVLLDFSDITRLVESETEASALRKRFELAARASQDAIFEWDIKTGDFWANEAYRTVYGSTPPARISPDALMRGKVQSGDHHLVGDALLEAINSGEERYLVDYDISRPDGTTGHVAVRAFIMRDESGNAQRIIGTGTDVGQLTRASAALEKSENRFRLIADSASDVLWDHDFESRLTWSSPDWPSKLGIDVDPSDAQEFRWIRVVEETDRQRLIDSFVEAVRSDATGWELEFKAKRSDGRLIDLAVKATILREPNGRASRMLGNMRNVTEERRNQEGYTRSRALEAVGQLTGGIAHDFNNLLMIIIGNVEALEMSDLSGENAETVAAISQAAESAAILTKRLLTFARQSRLNTTRVDVKAVLADTMLLLRAGLPESIRLASNVAPDIWSVDVDANGLEQALVNLAMNAKDALPRGGNIVLNCGNIEITDDASNIAKDLTPGRYVAISVADDGVGMPPHVRSRAFEPFFTTKDVGKGTGLGLSTVYGFARQSRGGVTIQSEEGNGATITLYLPASEESASSNLLQFDTSLGQVREGRRILVVEDHPQVRQHVEKTLRAFGYIVETAPDAAMALQAIEQNGEFDLLFTDIVMPGGMNGQELGAAVAARAPQMRLLYTSGYAAGAFEHLGIAELSNLSILQKPYKTADLREAVARALEGL